MCKRRRILALGLAAAMVFGMSGLNIGEPIVHAEEVQDETSVGETAPDGVVENELEERGDAKTETRAVEGENGAQISAASVEEGIRGLRLTGIRASIPDPIELPLEFSVEIEATAPESVRIRQVDLTYTNVKTGSQKTFSQDYYNYPGSAWMPGETGDITTVKVALQQYAGAGEYQLSRISFYAYEAGYSAQFDREEGSDTFSASDYIDGVEALYAQYSYDKGADFTIEKNENEDTTSPEVRSVSVLTNPVATGGKAEVSVDFQEVGSSVKTASVRFETEDGEADWFEEFSLNQGEYTGSGTLKLTSVGNRILGKKYKLVSVYIEDYAGNYNSYLLDETGSDLIARDNQGGEIGRISGISYEVTRELEAEWIEVTGIRIQDGVDKNLISAGDEFDVILTLKNNTTEERRIAGQSLMVRWSFNGNTIYKSMQSTNQIVVQPGDSVEVSIPYNINAFAEKGIYQLSGISYWSADYGYYVEYSRYEEGVSGGVYKNNEIIAQLPDYVYEGEADFTIAKADTPDREAPYIKSVRIATEDIKSPGNVKIEVQAEEGYAKATQINFIFNDTEDNRNSIHLVHGRESNMYYSDARRCYVIEAELSGIPCGDYQLAQIDISDEASQYRHYSKSQDGKLVDMADGNNQFDGVMLTVKESERKDRDFDSPVLEKVEILNKEIDIPGKIQYKIKAMDDSGITSLAFQYQLKDGAYVVLEPDEIKQDGEYYICNIKVGNYFPAGAYELTSIQLADGAYFSNSSYYSRKGNVLYCGQNGKEIAYSGELDINLKRTAEDASIIAITDEAIDAKLKALPNGTTVTITGMGYGYTAQGVTVHKLSKNTMQVIKDKSLKVRLIMTTYKDEILFDGEKLTNEMIQEFYVIFSEIWEAKYGVDFGNAFDAEGYGFTLEGSSGNIPLTLKLSINKEFYERNKDNNVRLGKRNYSEKYYRVCAENLKVYEENGYYYAEMKMNSTDDFGNTTYTVSSDTTKFFEECIEADTWTQSTSNEVVKGNEFTYNVRIGNENEEPLRDILVYPEMLNAEDGTEILLDGAYQITGVESRRAYSSRGGSFYDGKVTINEDGDAVISELKKGESVELAITVQVPETVATERVIMNTYAAIVNVETEELFAFGSTEFKMTLRAPQTVIKGDINGDGIVDASDLMFTLQIVSERVDASTLSAEQIQAGDVAGADGKITADDMMRLLQFVSERITSFE